MHIKYRFFVQFFATKSTKTALKGEQNGEMGNFLVKSNNFQVLFSESSFKRLEQLSQDFSSKVPSGYNANLPLS
ncbi:MAG: hypothetical protein AAGL29_11115, partial [Bacteroidota bacterium]